LPKDPPKKTSFLPKVIKPSYFPEKLLDILELSFSQLGDRFANKNQTSEAIFKLKSQVLPYLTFSA